MSEDTEPRPRLRAVGFTRGKNGEYRGTIQEIDAGGNATGEQHSGNFSNLRQREVFAAYIAKLRGIPSQTVLNAIAELLKEFQKKLEETQDNVQADGNEEERRSAERIADAAKKAAPLLGELGLLHNAIHAVEDLGVVGERRNIGSLHLGVRSRALSRPANLEVNSPPASGKTHVVTTTFSLECPDAVYELTAGSEHSLIYLGESLSNRIVYIQEPEGLMKGTGAAALKSLVWEGRLKYDTVVKDEEGNLVGQHIEKDGPTGLVVCTTRPLEEQISSRLLPLETDSSEEQTRRVLKAIAFSVNGARPRVDLEPWRALSYLLGEPVDVEIPFGAYLAENISSKTLRIRRDFTHLLTLIQASAVEYRYQRSAHPSGRLISTLADYAQVHALLAEVFEAAQSEGITKRDREMVQAVIQLSTPDGGVTGDRPVTQAAVRDYLKLSKSSASYRVRRLLRLGYLGNLADKGKPMQLIQGTPLPDEPLPLPTPCDLAAYLASTGRDTLVQPWINPVTGEGHDCRVHLGLEATIFFSSCPRCFEPPADSEAGDVGGIGGSDTVEPPEPLTTGGLSQASEGSQGSYSYEPPGDIGPSIAGADKGFNVPPGEGANISKEDRARLGGEDEVDDKADGDFEEGLI